MTESQHQGQITNIINIADFHPLNSEKSLMGSFYLPKLYVSKYRSPSRKYLDVEVHDEDWEVSVLVFDPLGDEYSLIIPMEVVAEFYPFSGWEVHGEDLRHRNWRGLLDERISIQKVFKDMDLVDEMVADLLRHEPHWFDHEAIIERL